MPRRLFALALTACLLVFRPAWAQPEFKIVVDPRIELLSAVEVLADYDWSGLITKHESAYAKEFREHFAPYSDHRAVELFNKMSKTGFSYDAPVAAILHYTSPPQLKPIVKMGPSIARRARGADQLDEFIEALRDFAVESNFQEFFDAHRTFYTTVEGIANAEAKAEGVDVRDLELYHGIEQTSYRLILAPMLHSGGFGPRVLRDDGTFDVYMITGPRRLTGDQPVFPKGADLYFLTMHEFGHSFINPLVEANSDEIGRYSELFNPISEQMSKMAYSQWETCVIEHIVRASDCRMHLAKQGTEEYERVVKNDIDRGFVYIDELCEALVRYETDRENYPTFADFFPELIAVFADAAADKGVQTVQVATKPKVIKSWPENGAANVDANMTELRVQFDQDMHQGGYAWVQSPSEGAYPETTGDPSWASARVAVLPVRLEPDTTYWIGLNYQEFIGFVSSSKKPAEEFILEFTTEPWNDN